MKIGYMRIPAQGQISTQQIESAKETLGVEKVFIDRESSGSTRPELKKLLAYVREGDTVIVESIDSFAKSARDFLNLVKKITDEKATFISQKEDINTATDTGEHMLTVLGEMVQAEREHVRQRQAEGIVVAKAKGKYKGRKRGAKSLNIPESAFVEQYKVWKERKISPDSAAEALGISRITFYRRVEEYEKKNGIDSSTEAEEAFAEQYKLWKNGETTVVSASQKLGFSRTTFYYHVKEYEKKHGITPSDESADTSAD